MAKIMNPKLATYKIRLRLKNGDFKYPGDAFTGSEAKKYEGRSISGIPLVVEGANVKTESDED